MVTSRSVKAQRKFGARAATDALPWRYGTPPGVSACDPYSRLPAALWPSSSPGFRSGGPAPRQCRRAKRGDRSVRGNGSRVRVDRRSLHGHWLPGTRESPTRKPGVPDLCPAVPAPYGAVVDP